MISKSRIFTYGLALIAFCGMARVASAAEVQLAGVKLGCSANQILQKLGNPNEINVGTTQQQTASRASSSAAGGGMGGGMGMGRMGGGMGMGRMGGGMGAGRLGGGGMGAGSGAGTGATASSATSSTNQSAVNAQQTITTWVYYFPKGKKDRQLRLTINQQGTVVEIEARAAEWKGLRTSRGISVGSTYRDIIAKYGFPDSQEQQGTSLLLKYRQKHQLVFTLVPPVLGVPATVAGINIAL